MLRRRYRLDVRTRTEVTKIDRAKKIVHVKELDSGEVASEAYDKLIIATGASPFRPPLPGIDSSRVLQLRDLSDADQMHQVVTSGAKRAVIIGAGFIGIEVAENLVRRGIETWLIELDKQILSPWDEEMVSPVAEHIQEKGVKLQLSDSATALQETDSGLKVSMQSGDALEVDFAVVCIGVRPENRLATDADIACGQRGGIVVNDSMQTSDSDIYAVGDVAQVECFITK